jgi:hypothetical protein
MAAETAVGGSCSCHRVVNGVVLTKRLPCRLGVKVFEEEQQVQLYNPVGFAHSELNSSWTCLLVHSDPSQLNHRRIRSGNLGDYTSG